MESMTSSKSMSVWARLFKAIRRRPFRSALAALAIIVVLVLAGIAAMLYSEPGRTAIAGYLEDAISTPGELEVRIDRLHGRPDRPPARPLAGGNQS
jgi:autotransporter translocation and assembly factor TamB